MLTGPRWASGGAIVGLGVREGVPLPGLGSVAEVLTARSVQGGSGFESVLAVVSNMWSRFELFTILIRPDTSAPMAHAWLFG